MEGKNISKVLPSACMSCSHRPLNVTHESHQHSLIWSKTGMRTRAPRALQQNEYPEEICWCGVKGDPSVGIFMTDCSCTFVLCVQRCCWRPLTDINTAPGSCARIEPLLAFSTRSKPELCALDWMLLTPHIVIVCVCGCRAGRLFPRSCSAFVSVEEGLFRCLTFHRRKDSTWDCSHVYSSLARHLWLY